MDNRPVYKRHIDSKGRTWLVRNKPSNDGNPIIVMESSPGDRGMDGAPMRFKLDDGTEIVLIGPWYSNQSYFEEATGVKL